MTNEKFVELQRLFEKQEKELLQSLITIRKEMAIIDGQKQTFRLYKPDYLKNPIYYAHLFDDNGKQTDARMSCKTIDKEKAKLYAIEHREDFLKEYFAKKNKDDFYKLLTEYYTEKSELFKKAKQKRSVRDKQVGLYKGFIDNYFIPFLKIRNITAIEKANNIDVIEDFQVYCQDEKQNGKYSLSAKTIKNDISCAVAPIFNQMLKEKSLFILNKNIFIKAQGKEKKPIGIIPIRTTFSILLNDNFWKNENVNTSKIPFLTNKIKNIERYRLYCLLSNLCGLRNSEIFLLRKENIIPVGRIHFLNIENSRIDGTGTKTEAGKRLVPLHPFIYKKLNQYIEKNNRTDYIFHNGSKTIFYNDFSRARTIFSLLCGYNEDDIKIHRIIFYSFRHFFKTMMTNALNEIDLIEYFMGHTNKSDMKKNYLQLGGIGEKYMENNGKKIISVIENYYSELYQKGKLIEDGKEKERFINTLQEPMIKEVAYNDVAHKNGKKYLIWTIPDPELIEDVYDYDENDIQDEKSMIETMNDDIEEKQ